MCQFDFLILCLKGCDIMSNSVNLDETALQEQFSLGLHCLLIPRCPCTWCFGDQLSISLVLTY